MELKTVEKRAEISELKRLFYVALTRARDYLLLSATAKEVKAETIDEGRSWLDWLELVVPGIISAEEGLVYLDKQPIKLTRSVTVTAPLGLVFDQQKAGVEEIASTLELPVTTQR